MVLNKMHNMQKFDQNFVLHRWILEAPNF